MPAAVPTPPRRSLVVLGRFALLAPFAFVGVGVGAFDWRAGLIAAGAMMWAEHRLSDRPTA